MSSVYLKVGVLKKSKVFVYVFKNSGVLTPHVLSEWMVEVCIFRLVYVSLSIR